MEVRRPEASKRNATLSELGTPLEPSTKVLEVFQQERTSSGIFFARNVKGSLLVEVPSLKLSKRLKLKNPEPAPHGCRPDEQIAAKASFLHEKEAPFQITRLCHFHQKAV